MSQQIINVGSAPNDGQGDGLRTAYIKCNNNFTELYANIARPQSMGDGGSNITVGYPSGPIIFTVNDQPNVMVVSNTSVNINGLANIVGGANITGNAFITGTTTMAGNAMVLGNITTGGILTDHYYYANGAPVDFEQPAGSNTQIQYNNNGSFGASPAFTFNQSTNAFSVLGTMYVQNDTILNGNLTVNGTTVTANATVLNVQDPIIGLGRGANNAPLTTNDGKDRGEQMWYFTTSEKSAFTGYQNASGKILLATDVSITNEIVAVNALGNVLMGNAEVLALNAAGNVTGGNLITTGVISAVGAITGASLSVSGAVSAGGNVTGGNLNSLGVVSSVGTVFAGNLSTTGFMSAAGNVTGGNINTSGLISATGNIAGGNINTSGLVSATGNVTGGNLTTTGLISATGSISTSAFISAAGNITGGNLTTTGVMSATTINGGSLSLSGNITAGNITGNVSGTITVPGTNTQLLFNNNGNLGAATVTYASNGLSAAGNITASYFVGTATTAQYADLAEMYCSDYPYEPGTVVSFGGGYEITLSLVDMDRTIAGVVSTDPAYLMNSNLECENAVPVALQGRVPCKVTGPVRKGDMMVSAGGGYARAEANPTIGSVIGKALADHVSGEGVIEVVVGRI